MFLRIAIVCLAAVAARAQECPSVIHPVCASNGKVYDNNCEFLKARKELLDLTSERIEIVKLGACAKRSPHDPFCPKCPQKEQPVCASNGLTYKNTCFFRCNRVPIFEQTGEKIAIVKTGHCQSNVTRSPEEDAVVERLNAEAL